MVDSSLSVKGPNAHINGVRKVLIRDGEKLELKSAAAGEFRATRQRSKRAAGSHRPTVHPRFRQIIEAGQLPLTEVAFIYQSEVTDRR